MIVSAFLAVFAALLLAATIFYAWFMVDSVVRGHDLATSRRAARKVCEIIAARKPEARTLYDLGCARGFFAIFCKKSMPGVAVAALDKSRFRLGIAQARALLAGQKVNFRREDVYRADLSGADVVYTCLWYDQMPVLEKKFSAELPKGALIITNTSFLPSWQPVETHIVHPKTPQFEKLFVYVKE